jgi:archaellum component FlaC
MVDSAKIQITGDNAPLKVALGQSFSMLKTFAGSVAGSFAGFAVFGALTAGASGIAHFFGEAVEAAEKFERSLIKFNTVLQGTGNVTGFTRRELEKMQQTIAKTTEYTATAAREAQVAFIKMGTIRGDVFEKGLKTASDLAAFLGNDLPQAAEFLGRALQNPAAGMMRLQRMGLGLTAEQKKSINTLLEQNKLYEAQLKLLEDINAKGIQGLAAKFAETFSGQLGQFSKEINKAKKQLGEELLPILVDLLPILNAIKEVAMVAMKGIGILVEAFISDVNNLLELLINVWAILERIATLGQSGAFVEFGSLDEARMKRREKAKEIQKALDDDTKKKLDTKTGMDTGKKEKGAELKGTFEGLVDTWKRISSAGANAGKDPVAVAQDAAQQQQSDMSESIDVQENLLAEQQTQTKILVAIRDRPLVATLANA